MLLNLLLFFPVFAGTLILLVDNVFFSRVCLGVTAGVHVVLTAAALVCDAYGIRLSALGGLLNPDALGLLFLAIASLLFAAATVYGIDYLRREAMGQQKRRDIQGGQVFTNAPERRFSACLCIFLAAMTLVTLTPHFGALWVGIEVTTLSSAPLIYFHRHRHSMEATWKYLMICSVGIALALLGNILMSVAFYAPGSGGEEGMNQVALFMQRAAEVCASPDNYAVPWLKASFIFLLVGYGTKMGLAPLHNWLPDAHSQAPSLVSALLSGALLNCAFLGILRGYQVMAAAGLGEFSARLLVFFGLVSLGIAAAFIIGQRHYKRLLAYSSIEHMGILALGVGIGGSAVFGALFHAICHSLTKCMLFLLAGNILDRYKTYSCGEIYGMRRVMPLTAALWVGGFLAIVGSPPFGLFFSELTILKGIFESGGFLIAVLYSAALAIIFIGMSVPVLRMVQGTRPEGMTSEPEPLASIVPPLILGCLCLMMGVYTPAWLTDFLGRGAGLLGG
ncbi:MAG: proton-conducting transporter membrane subunit [Desulfovibrionaceae bacterium]|nr:proton-conducting transporter membrane subunit [Desulfovibrionaceae bacterium]